VNADNNAKRRFILVQLPEPIDSSIGEQRIAAEYCDQIKVPRNVAELTKERLRRAARKIGTDSPQFGGDLGFRVFKLDSSNIRAWSPDPDNLARSLFDNQDHLLEGRSEFDLLYELLIKLGLDLCVPIAHRSIGGKDVNAVGGGVLMACLAMHIDAADVEVLAHGIVAWCKDLAPAGDTTCVFRDSAFADDVAKTNMVAILSQNGIQNVRSL
jgi:adenine-specific DNA-methyltransferase